MKKFLAAPANTRYFLILWIVVMAVLEFMHFTHPEIHFCNLDFEDSAGTACTGFMEIVAAVSIFSVWMMELHSGRKKAWLWLAFGALMIFIYYDDMTFLHEALFNSSSPLVVWIKETTHITSKAGWLGIYAPFLAAGFIYLYVFEREKLRNHGKAGKLFNLGFIMYLSAIALEAIAMVSGWYNIGYRGICIIETGIEEGLEMFAPFMFTLTAMEYVKMEYALTELK